jgi:LysM repeat protein
MKFRTTLLLIAMALNSQLFSQSGPSEVINAYIETYRELAITEMQRTGVPASIKLAQGILETEAGRSNLVMRSNNHFGIKCKSWWTGEKVYHDDDEQGECFRKYPTAQDSYKDHSDYLKNTERYSSLFRLDPIDYKAWAHGLKAAGYATNPKYPQILIKYIELYNLNDYSFIALGRKAHESMTSTAAVQPPVTSAKSVSAGPPVARKAEGKKTDIKKTSYPAGEFKINNTKVIYAKAGTPLKEIADKFLLNPDWIIDFNDLKSGESILPADQLVFLQRKRRQGEKEYHVVEDGEDLYSISQKQGIRLESLLNYNQLSADMTPAPGEKLYLQNQGPARPRLAYVQ